MSGFELILHQSKNGILTFQDVFFESHSDYFSHRMRQLVLANQDDLYSVYQRNKLLTYDALSKDDDLHDLIFNEIKHDLNATHRDRIYRRGDLLNQELNDIILR